MDTEPDTLADRIKILMDQDSNRTLEWATAAAQAETTPDDNDDDDRPDTDE